jgi:hypothetical protein
MRKIKYFFKNCLTGLSNIIYWFKYIWRDKDYDFSYIFIVLEKKLEKQAKFMELKSLHANAKRDAQIMKTCVRLMKLVREEYYRMQHMDYHESVLHFDDVPDNPDYKQLRIENLSENYDDYFKKYPLVYKRILNSLKTNRQRDKAYIAMKISWANHEKAKALVFKILNERIEHWWN